MSDPAYAVQVGEAAALLAAPAVVDIVGEAVYDDLSAPGSAYPRIEVGDTQVLGETNTCFDSSEIYSTVHLRARGPDARLVVKQLAGAVRPVLAAPFALDGHKMTSALFHDGRYMTEGDETDPDGLVCHGVLTFHYRTIPQTGG